ncbi:MAG: hypothetical protein AB7P69_10350 [Candidatus Binatia bacterium]
MKILLTFTGFRDPYAVGLIGQEEQPGRILSLTSARKQLILRALETAKGDQSEAARLRGFTPQAVHEFLRKGEDNFLRRRK